MLLDYKAIGRRIKYFRLQKKLTQNKLAEQINVSDKYISAIETGSAKVSLSRLYDIASTLSVDITMLLKDVDSNSPTYIDSEICELIQHWTPNHKELLLRIINDMDISLYIAEDTED